MTFIAKWDGKCAECGGRVVADETEMTWVQGTGSVHVKCPDEALLDRAGDLRVGKQGVCGDCFSELPSSGVCGVC